MALGSLNSLAAAAAKAASSKRRPRRTPAAPTIHERREHAGKLPQPGVPLPGSVPDSSGRFTTPSFLTLPKTGPAGVPDAATAIKNAYLFGQKPDPRIAKYHGKDVFQTAEQARIAYLGRKDNLKEPSDLTNLILLASGAGELTSLIRSAGEIGARGLAEAGAAAAAKQAAGTAESTGLKQLVAGAARKVEPEALAAARKGIARSAARAPLPVKVAAKVGGKAAAYPFRHPLTSPVSAQIPAAFIHGNPGEFVKALEGKGTFADISGTLSGAAASIAPFGGLGKQVVAEALNLPAVVLPSVYLPLAGAVEAAHGNPAHLEALWKQYMDTGLLPAAAQGNLQGILKALKERPLYSALEASGAVAAAGRGAGALSRLGGRSMERAPRTIEGYPNVSVSRGPYSPDLLREAIQRTADRRSGSVIRPGTRRGDNQLRRAVVRNAGDRFVANAEAVRRLHREDVLKQANELMPKKRVAGVLKRMDTASADVVAHAIERVIQSPATFHGDLTHYRDQLNAVYGEGHLDKAQAAANRELVKQIDAGIKRATPEHVVEAANAFIAAHKPIVDELVEQGVLAPDQALKASVIPFARVHMGAGYKEGVGVVDKAGNPLSLDQITAEMHKRGIEPPGFLSHRAPTRGDWYRAWYPERGSLPKGARTGESIASGSRAGGFDAVVRQLARSRGLLDRVKTWDAFISRFGVDLRGAGVEKMADALRVLRDPARYGLNPAIDWVPVRRSPFIAMKSEIQGALEHQDPTVAAEGVMTKALDVATDMGNPDGPIVFMPKALVENMAEHFKPLSSGMKAMQLSATTLKRAVLPYSPSYFYGNAIDNMIRTALAGIGPQHFIAGRKIAMQMSPETRTELLGGAGYSSVERMAVRRSAEDFRGTSLEGVANAMAHFRNTPGPKQAIDLIRSSSRILLAVNSRLTEVLPQYGALGKIATRDVQAMQGRWATAMRLQPDVIEQIAKGLENPDTMIRYQRAMEDIYGNWSRMSPHARKFLSNFAPFWTWSRAATKLVFITLPAHHSVQTAILTAAARMTQPEREQFGLDKFAAEPLPGFAQGGLPIRGSISPWGKYTSFGYGGNLIESLASSVLPQVRGMLANLEGRDWKGAELKGDETSRIMAALRSGVESFIPGYNTVAGIIHNGPGFLSPVHVQSPGAVAYERTLSHSQQIRVPESGSSSGGAPWKSGSGVNSADVFSGGGGGSGVDSGEVFSGGGTAPWKSSESSSSGKAPWK